MFVPQVQAWLNMAGRSVKRKIIDMITESEFFSVVNYVNLLN